MKSTLLIFSSLFLIFSSCNTSEKIDPPIDDQTLSSKDSNLSIISSKSGMSFFDTDSIYKQKFITTSINDGSNLFWEIEIYDETTKTKNIVDSSDYSLNYLVDACDLNSDGVGELVIVAANDKLQCKIYYYIKVDHDWVKRIIPELNEKQLEEYSGSDIITVKRNKIIRKYPIKNKENKETGKERVISYRLTNNFDLIIKQENK